MILSGHSIRERCMLSKNIVVLISPFHERTRHEGYSFGVGPAGYDVRIDQDIFLPPNGFILASTMERFEMHNDILGIVHDKSTWARQGITVQNTVIEPCWKGWLTLEVTNHSSQIIAIKKGMPIAQIIFHLLDKPVSAGYDGKYHNQQRGPQPARFYSKESQ